MIDPKLLREQPEAVASGLARRGAPFDVSAYRELDAKRKTLQVRSEKLRAERNRLSKGDRRSRAYGWGRPRRSRTRWPKLRKG